MQRYNLCKDKLSAKILCMNGVQQHVETLHAFGKMVTDLAGTAEGEDVTSQNLLRAPPTTQGDNE